MKIEKLQDIGDREKLREILSKTPPEVTDYESKFLRARRSYLSLSQKIKYVGILYFSKPALYIEFKSIFYFLSKFTKEIIIGVIITMIVFWIMKAVGW